MRIRHTLWPVAQRNFVKFTFFKVRPEWRRRERRRARAGQARVRRRAARTSREDHFLRTYSLVGTRGDADLMVRAVASSLDPIHELHVLINQSGLMRWADTPYSYLAMTKESVYSDEPQPLEPRPGSDSRYLFVYPMWKKREWYTLPRRGADADHEGPHRDRPPVRRRSRSTPPTLTAWTIRSSSCRSTATTRASSWIWCRSCGVPSRAPTRSRRRPIFTCISLVSADRRPSTHCERRNQGHHDHRRRPRRHGHRVLGRHARGQLADHRLAAGARRPAHDALPREVDLRRARLPADPRQGPRRGAPQAVARAVRRARLLETTADRVEYEDSGRRAQILRLVTDKGDFLSRTIIIAGGHGAFEPKKLPGYDMTPWEGKGAYYLVGEKSEFAGKDVVIIGGGDSACDWVLNLLDTAELDHARPPARGLPRARGDRQGDHGGGRGRQGRREDAVPGQGGVEGNGRIEKVTIFHSEDEDEVARARRATPCCCSSASRPRSGR